MSKGTTNKIVPVSVVRYPNHIRTLTLNKDEIIEFTSVEEFIANKANKANMV